MRISLNHHMACDVLEDMRFFKNFKTNELLRHKIQANRR